MGLTTDSITNSMTFVERGEAIFIALYGTISDSSVRYVRGTNLASSIREAPASHRVRIVPEGTNGLLALARSERLSTEGL